ncbi:PHP domain-containing protein [Garciella nitratireducens]|uniref:Polymerase/histidinol phosphatase N-terminal domain-containing protein n=1 Tax=Garciella nitratireducens DSM 15102 TaxID=1121911 RepID=A0A1T4L139_9FIRM|nr:PHP domain-containing protein [Garciella nitratireducens]SJZ48250.1 hypothetical protein SAMN02745973_00767 [Garciella nitratireducens DSM 15102]
MNHTYYWAYDLHIHSALSPCAHSDMTPNNIVNMALLKNLDVISVTDHNTTQNLPAVFKVAKDKDLLIIPGIEVTTKEEVHLLCYFPSLDSAMLFEEYIKTYLPSIKNQKEFFGEQWILDEQDEIIGEVEFLLINALSLSIDKIFKAVQNQKGVVVPAHIDKSSYSIISNLGWIPSYLSIHTLELSVTIQKQDQKLWTTLFPNYRWIQSSDAHSLEHILERQSFFEFKKLTIQNILGFLKGM